MYAYDNNHRTMWRTLGAGELYAYIPENLQQKDLCQREGVYCDATYGYSLGRGSWTFKTGEWIKVKQVVHLNQPGQPDGRIKLTIDGKTVYAEKGLAFVSEKADSALRIGMCLTINLLFIYSPSAGNTYDYLVYFINLLILVIYVYIIAFHTFFGGSKAQWAAKKTEYTYFKGISLKVYY